MNINLNLCNMERINIAELLKNCPQGMELDCPMYENLYFDGIDETQMHWYPIKCYTVIPGLRTSLAFSKFGESNKITTAKCVIFPKGKTTWEGFVPPCKFKDGDVIFTHANCLKVGLGNTWISIFQEKRNGGVATYVDMSEDGKDYYDYIGDKGLLCMDKDIMRQRLATEEEKQKLFDAIREKGYHWNTESKTLEKLVEPKFKIEKGKWYVCIKDLLDNYANKAFCKGDIYLSTQDGSLIPSNSNIPFEVFCPTTYFIPWTIQDAKDGDIITMGNEWGVHIFIYNNTTDKYNDHGYYAILTSRGNLKFNGFCNGKTYKLVNEEEKKKFFQVIKDNGYKWNPETKSLEKLPKFKVGDEVRLKLKPNYVYTIHSLAWDDNQRLAYRLLPNNDKHLILVSLNAQDDYELVPSKFDISKLKPFDKVLVRCSSSEKWRIQFFEKYDKSYQHPFICMGPYKYKQCVPYEGNEHLLDTTNDCDEYFKNL